MTSRWSIPVAAIAALATTSCAADEELSCAAVVSYGEPALTIDSVTGADGEPVETIVLSELRRGDDPVTLSIDGRPWTGAGSSSPPWFGLERAPGSAVRCRVPCGFTTNDGRGELTFVVSTDDGGRERHQVNDGYASSDDTCAATARDGAHVDLRLRK